MLRLLVSLLSSLQIGVRLKREVRSLLAQTMVIAIAVAIFLGAITFGLSAGYSAMVAAYGYDPAEAGGIFAALLALVGFLLLGLAPLLGRRKMSSEPVAAYTSPPMEFVRQPVREAMDRYGTVTMLLIAFAGGFLLSRR
jgi:hypothetical protein